MSCLGTVFTFGAGMVSAVALAGLLAMSGLAGEEPPPPDYRPTEVHTVQTVYKDRVITKTPESCAQVPKLAEEYKDSLYALSALVTEGELLASQAQQAVASESGHAEYISKARNQNDSLTPLKVAANTKREALESAVSLCSQESQ